MKIEFEKDGHTIFAVAYDEIIDGYLHTELIIGEIDEALGGYMVRFESAFSDPIHCATLDEAKALIERDYYKYKPASVGRNYFMG